MVQQERLGLNVCSTLEDRAREQVDIVKNNPFLRKEFREKTTGYVFDLQDGSLKQVA